MRGLAAAFALVAAVTSIALATSANLFQYSTCKRPYLDWSEGADEAYVPYLMGHGENSAIRTYIVRLDETYDLDEHLQKTGIRAKDIQEDWLECGPTRTWDCIERYCYRAQLDGAILATVRADSDAHSELAYEAPIYRPESGCAIPDDYIVHLANGRTMDQHMQALDERWRSGQGHVLTTESVKEILGTK